VQMGETWISSTHSFQIKISLCPWGHTRACAEFQPWWLLQSKLEIAFGQRRHPRH
jgi:hypothetical protein